MVEMDSLLVFFSSSPGVSFSECRDAHFLPFVANTFSYGRCIQEDASEDMACLCRISLFLFETWRFVIVHEGLVPVCLTSVSLDLRLISSVSLDLGLECDRLLCLLLPPFLVGSRLNLQVCPLESWLLETH